MDNKKYIDKVIGSLVRGTRIDYEKERIYYPFSPLPSFYLPYSTSPFITNYCKNHFGLTDDEIEYVWEEYRSIILDKINNGQ